MPNHFSGDLLVRPTGARGTAAGPDLFRCVTGITDLTNQSGAYWTNGV